MPEMTANLANFTDRHGQNVEIDKLNSGGYCITVDGRMTQNDRSADDVIRWFSNASHCEPKRSAYQPFTKDSILPAAEESYVLVRRRGDDIDDGFPHTPVVAQLLEGKFFTPQNGVKAVSWQKGDSLTENPYEANLEWMPLPK